MTCAKVSYNTSAKADAGLHSQWRKARSGKLPVRSYLCQCGKWHLTSKELGK